MTRHEAADLEHIHFHTQTLWEDLRGSSVFIAGGTGFLGYWLSRSFTYANEVLNLDAHLTILTRNPDAFSQRSPEIAENPAVTILKGDVRTFDLPDTSFTHIINAATDASVEKLKQFPEQMEETIVEGARRTLELAEKSGAKRYLFVSSGAVYGPQPREMMNIEETYDEEEHLQDPPVYLPYARGKRTAEHLCAMSTVHATIARCFAFVGPNMPLDVHYAVGNFIGNAVRNEPIIIKSDGTPVRSYLHTADAAIWLWTMLQKGEKGRAYNVGSGEGHSLKDIAGIVRELSTEKPPITILGNPNPDALPERYVPSVKRAESELGLKQHLGLEQALKRTMDAILASNSI